MKLATASSLSSISVRGLVRLTTRRLIRLSKVISDIPTLFLTGALDPVTPPVWSFDAAAGFSRSHVAVIPALGHAVAREPCAADLDGC